MVSVLGLQTAFSGISAAFLMMRGASILLPEPAPNFDSNIHSVHARERRNWHFLNARERNLTVRLCQTTMKTETRRKVLKVA